MKHSERETRMFELNEKAERAQSNIRHFRRQIGHYENSIRSEKEYLKELDKEYGRVKNAK